jgi:N-carbamoylputrescine amidase
LEFWGQSFVAAPSGEVIAEAGIDMEEIMMAKLNMRQINEARTHWPFLRDSNTK